MSFFKSPWFAILSAAVGAALPVVAADFPQLAPIVAVVGGLIHLVTTQFAKNSPSPQVKQ